jgi:hypothetical protein
MARRPRQHNDCKKPRQRITSQKLDDTLSEGINIVRLRFGDIWKRHEAGMPLQGRERHIAEAMAARPKWAFWWNLADDLGDAKVTTPEGDPFVVIAQEADGLEIAQEAKELEVELPDRFWRLRRALDGSTGELLSATRIGGGGRGTAPCPPPDGLEEPPRESHWGQRRRSIHPERLPGYG